MSSSSIRKTGRLTHTSVPSPVPTIWRRDEARAHGFKQYDPIGNQWISPFRLSDPDLADADHSRPALYAKADGGKMDLYVAAEEGRMLRLGATLQDAQRVGILTMAHEDCDTIPFLWKYAHTFALYDHIFQAMYGPSTPGNIDLVAAQTGQTQWARHPSEAVADSDDWTWCTGG